MKTLIIVRHGKSSWDNPCLGDRERPLKERGVNDAGKMAAQLLEMKEIPELILSSPAKRALHTAEIFAETFAYPSGKIVIENDLYFQGSRTISDLVRSQDNQYDKLMIAGHNPDFTELANQFLSQTLYNLPTAGVVILHFDCENWKDISRKNLMKDIYLIPKKL
jgi:phosphohistidine phosphatase